ncbi:hypothetical protein D5086_019943 [Populus alba]|uniref:Uncharacterized protein n=1 Tax=Populus alba TaxID=43335 RepID=A0ACC4BK50_POPAL
MLVSKLIRTIRENIGASNSSEACNCYNRGALPSSSSIVQNSCYKMFQRFSLLTLVDCVIEFGQRIRKPRVDFHVSKKFTSRAYTSAEKDEDDLPCSSVEKDMPLEKSNNRDGRASKCRDSCL